MTPNQKPSPEESPFEESDAEASLRRIGESVRALDQAEAAHFAAKLALDVAKDEAKKTGSLVARLKAETLEFARGETKELPLFPRLKADGSPAPAPTAAAPPASDPATFALLLMPGLPSTVALKLADRGIHTVGDLAKFTEGGGKLTDVKGISEALAEKALAALADFWKSRGVDAA